MGGSLDHLSNSDSVESLIRENAHLRSVSILDCDCVLVLDDGHLFVIELNEVINDQIVSCLEDINCSDHTSDAVVEDVSVLGPQVVENILGLSFSSEIDGSGPEYESIAVPQFAGILRALLIKLEDPKLGGKPDGAVEGTLVLQQLLKKDAAGDWLILEDSLENQCEFLKVESAEEERYVLSEVVIVIGGLHHVDGHNDKVNVSHEVG